MINNDKITQNLATHLHTRFCGGNHTDGCGWYYENGNWDQFTHSLWYRKAEGIRNVCRFEGVSIAACINIINAIKEL